MNLIWIVCFLVYSIANSVQDCRVKKISQNGDEQIYHIPEDDQYDYYYYPMQFSRRPDCREFDLCHILCDTWEDFRYSSENIDIKFNYTSLKISLAQNGLESNIHRPLRVDELILDETGLQEISSNVFSVFTATKHVYLSRNRIRTIDAGVFNSLTDLVTLDLSYNEIEFINSTAFAENKELSFLYLNNNKFLQISQLIFNHETSLSVLNFASNNLSSFDLSLFQAVSQIKVVNISQNNLNDESLLRFSKYHRIEELIMSHNHFKIVKKEYFLELTDIKVIDLSHNEIQAIERDLFENSIELKVLDLSGNLITSIEEECFENLTQLEELYLNDNQLSVLPNLSKQKSLKSINILNNSLKNISFNRCNFSKIEELLLQNFNLNFFGIQFSLVSPNAKTIRLSNNTIDRIDSKMFSNLINLKHLDVSYNLIYSISKDAFRGTTNLENLQLQGNHLKSISSHLFNNMHNMLYLDMSYNNLVGFPLGSFDSLNNLLSLNLSFNNIKRITKYNLHSMVNLTTLSLNNNDLLFLGGLEYVKSLKYISLDNNQWNCEYLFELVHTLKERNIFIVENNASLSSQSHIYQIKCYQAEQISSREKVEFIDLNENYRNSVNTTAEHDLILDHKEYIPSHSLDIIVDAFKNATFILEYKNSPLMYINSFALIGIFCTTCIVVYIKLFKNKTKFVKEMELL